MATTTSFVKHRTTSGGVVVQAQGTMADAANGGTFAVRLSADGSIVLRNIQTVHITNLGSQSVIVGGAGTTGNYVTLSTVRFGSLTGESVVHPGDGTVDINWMVTGGGGSV